MLIKYLQTIQGQKLWAYEDEALQCTSCRTGGGGGGGLGLQGTLLWLPAALRCFATRSVAVSCHMDRTHSFIKYQVFFLKGSVFSFTVLYSFFAVPHV